MGRKNPIAGVYRIRNITNGKIYFGESGNLSDRISHYRTVGRGRNIGNYPTKVEQAIINEGIENFCIATVVTELENPKIKDDMFRRDVEMRFIRRYNTTDPEIGYNTKEDNRYYNCGRKKGTPTATSTKLVKSTPIIGYNFDKREVFIYLSSLSAAKTLGIDKAIVARCCKNGKSTHNHQFFYLEYDKRKSVAIKIINYKKSSTSKNGLSDKTLKRYIEALEAANELCIAFGFKPVNIDKILNNID